MKVSLSFSDQEGAAVREAADAAGLSLAEVLRRGMTLYRVWEGLGPDEELVVRDRRTKECERLVIHWGV